MYVFLVFAAIVASIVLGLRFKINIGIPALLFALLIGRYALGLSFGSVLQFWPTTIFVQLVIVTLFYSFATGAGAVSYIANQTIWLTRKTPRVVPIAFALLCFILAAIGIPPVGTSMLLYPIFTGYSRKIGIDETYVGVLSIIAGIGGMLSPTGYLGILVAGIIIEAGLDAPFYSLQIFKYAALTSFILMAAFYFILGLYKPAPVIAEAEKPGKADRNQKRVLIIILVIVSFMFLPQIVDRLYANPITGFLKGIDITVLYVIGILACVIAKIGNEREMLKTGVPWNVLILVGGMSCLMSVLTKAGFVEMTGDALRRIGVTDMPSVLIIFLFVIGSGVLSLFCDGVNVVTPLFVSLAISLSSVVQFDLALAMAFVPIGALCTGISPLSTGGALAVSFVEEKRQNRILRRLLFSAFLSLPMLCVIVLAFSLGKI